MNLNRILLVLLCAGIASCKKHKEQPVTPPGEEPAVTYDSYSALKVGNYWIYEQYYRNTETDSTTPQGRFDSCYIEKDTVINGNTYFKYCRKSLNNWGAPVDPWYLRDSLHYIVTKDGSIRFSSQDFATVFYSAPFGPNNATGDTFTHQRKMTAKDVAITVPAGTFSASAFSQLFIYQPWKQLPDVVISNWYAKNIGMVRSDGEVYLGQPQIHLSEQWLVRYHLE